MTRLEFTVLGEPAPQGSKTRTRHGGIREANARTEPWRQAVASAALEAMDARELPDSHVLASTLIGPLALRATFVFTRPAGHYGTGRNAGVLKPSAPSYCPKRPDLDKLLRAIGDALTGIVYRDDAQVVLVGAQKRYGAPPCARIVIEEVDG